MSDLSIANDDQLQGMHAALLAVEGVSSADFAATLASVRAEIRRRKTADMQVTHSTYTDATGRTQHRVSVADDTTWLITRTSPTQRWRVWRSDSLDTLSKHDMLPAAINAAMRRARAYLEREQQA